MANTMNELTIARRMKDIQPFHVMAILARARELEASGRSVIHMEIGEPDFVTPAPIIEAGQQAIGQGLTHYTPTSGLPELREAIAGFYHDQYGQTISSNRIIVTPGASGALLLILGILVNPGDQVLMADPGYPCNRNFVRFLEGTAVGIPVDGTTQYQLNKELIEKNWTDNTVAVMLASPSNPTGTLVSGESLKEIAAFVKSKNGFLIVDEIYHGLIYDEEYNTALAVADDVFVINSFSKYFSMTGWRLGWLVAPDAYIKDLDKLAQNLFLAAPTPAQYAALAAFNKETKTILDKRCDEFKQRRDFLLPALRDLGFKISGTPQGAFYLYADCSAFTQDSYQFAIQLLEEKGVAITPGIDFGQNKANTHVRFAYTTSLENLREGVERIRAYLA